jgi:hypothetical protein
MVSGSSHKWRKRDVSVGEARERFTALVNEFKDGQKVGETSLADTDDLDREAPEEVVQGVSRWVFSERALMDGKSRRGGYIIGKGQVVWGYFCFWDV